MPKTITYKSFENNENGVVGGWMNARGEMAISKEYINQIKYAVKEYIQVSAKDKNAEQNIINQLNNKQNFTNYMNIFTNLLKKYPETSNEYVKHTYTSNFSVINHEMGHLQHCVNTKSNLVDLDEKSFELFTNSKDIASNISKYAETSPTEFVAECFSKIVDGHKLDDKTMELYKQLGGYII